MCKCECYLLFILLFSFLLYRLNAYQQKKPYKVFLHCQTPILQCYSHSRLQTLKVMFNFHLVHGFEPPWPSSFTIFPLSTIFLHLYFSRLLLSNDTFSINKHFQIQPCKENRIRHPTISTGPPYTCAMAKDLTSIIEKP